MSEKITCKICGAQEHSIQIHLRKAHPERTTEQNTTTKPDTPQLSEAAKAALEKKRAQAETTEAAAPVVSMAGTAANVATLVPKGHVTKKFLHEVIELGAAKAARSAMGDPKPKTKKTTHTPKKQTMVPDVSDNYVYDIDELKN